MAKQGQNEHGVEVGGGESSIGWVEAVY